MKWWSRRRLHTKIFLAFSALILVLLLLTLWFTQLAVSRQVQSTLKNELVTTGQVFQGLVVERGERLLANSTLLTGDFALKKAIATYDPTTLASVALNYQERIGVDLLWITDETGVFLADSMGMEPSGKELGAFPPLAEALNSEEPAAAVAEMKGTLFQLVAVPILGPDVIGFLILGKAIDDATARQLREDTGSDISFLTAKQLFASSWPTTEKNILFPQGAIAPRLLQTAQGGTFLTALNGERFLSILVPIASSLSRPLYALVQQSYDKALAPLNVLRRYITGIAAVCILAALVIGISLARGITSPVQGLVSGMREVLKGNFAHRLEAKREDEIGFLAHSFNEMVTGLEEREKIKDTFGRFVSRDVAEAVLSDRVPLAGERREVSILFQDIRGFTKMGEMLDPVELLTLLNEFFTEAVASVETEGGIVKQFTGDGVMALFGAPVAHSDDPERAVRAALGMLSRLERLTARRSSEGLPTFRIGVGIHTGDVVAGKIGPDWRVEYGVVGDPVNLASRIEGLTKDVYADILVSKTTASRLGPGFRLGRSATLAVKGKEKTVKVVEVLGYEERQEVQRLFRNG